MQIISLAQDFPDRVARRADALQARYDAAAALGTAEQRARAEALLAQIGTVDWQGEGFPDPENQRDLSIRFTWGHDHRFAGDLAVSGRMGTRHIDLAAQFIEGFGLAEDHFAGRNVLDIGCWTGGTTLMLKALGAGAVTALEEVRKYARTAQDLATGVYGHDDVRCLDRSLYTLADDDGRFDCVYVPGVVYHLSDPVLALRLLYNRLVEGGDILVESAGIDRDGTLCLFKGNRDHFGGEAGTLSRSGWAWFWPTPTCLAAWLDEAGFEDISVFWSPVSKRVFAHARRRAFRQITRAGLSRPDVE